MGDKERLRNLIRAMAEEFDNMADEYEQRIKDYQEALTEVERALSGMPLTGEEGESPDGLMSELLMEQDALQDNLEEAFPDGFVEETELDGENLRDVINAVRLFQAKKEDLDNSMDDPVRSGLRDILVSFRDVLDAALVENKADYARLLANIERLGEFWEFTE